ncbi:G-rich sequence factor 1 [Labrus mixtus]|uniref:G-rich sequence factor 1 n=1 Tax=Labrus mixtus TaxID=508554 RepID=UPI0029C037CD|nr:G-rich sequence factor 1 [Labrus mixtus]
MSGNSKSVLFLLQRCVAVGQVTLSTGIKTRASVLSSKLIQQRTWTSKALTVCLQRPCELQSAVKTSQYSFCTKAGTSCEGEYPPLPAYQTDPEPEKKEVFIVQVKGLPWSCSVQDLLQFFSECRIRDGEKGIHLTLDRMGRPSGRAFLELEHEEDVSKALEKHRQYLGPRYVEVYEVSNCDAEEILKNAIQTPAEDGVVRLRGLPFSCTEADVAQFFSGLDIVQNGITLVKNMKGKNSGEGYVQFSSQEAANKALQRDREVIGNRYIEVFPSKHAEIRTEWQRRSISSSPQTSHQIDQANPRTGLRQSSAPPVHFIHVRGLPFQVSGEDIVEFFSPLKVSKILIECSPEGRPSGEADIFFSCHQDATTAMTKDRQHIGERYIELFLNSAPDSNGR